MATQKPRTLTVNHDELKELSEAYGKARHAEWLSQFPESSFDERFWIDRIYSELIVAFQLMAEARAALDAETARGEV